MSQQPPAVPEFIRVDRLLADLKALEKKHEQQGRVSHAAGVRSAIALVKRDTARLLRDC